MGRIVAGGFGALVVLFLIGPLVAIVPIAFTSSDLFVYPIPSTSLRWFEILATEPVWRRALVNTFIIGGATTVLSVTLGLLIALGLRRRHDGIAGFLRTLFMLPMVIPTVVLGIGLQLVFFRLGLENTYIAVILAHTIVALPFALIALGAAFAGADRRVEMAAASLGAAPFTVFREITLPMIRPGVISAAVLSFATSLDEVVITLFVAGPNQRTLARQMFASIRENISPAIAAAAVVFLLLTAAIVTTILILNRVNRFEQEKA